MLQIIGWLGCLYLLVKAFEFGMSSTYHDKDGKMKEEASVPMLICILGAFGFAIWLGVQGDAVATTVAESYDSGLLNSKIDCINAATTSQELEACAN